jgi:F-type H+-transporting ATPase subunit b
VITQLTQFAAESTEHVEAAGGIAALGINLKGFLFQLITFVLVLILLKKYVFGKLVDTLEARRNTVLESLEQAKQATEELQGAEEKIEKLLAEARQESADIVATAHKEAVALVEEAETKAVKKAEHIVHEAKGQLDQEVLKARELLKKETKSLVAAATESVIRQKLTGAADEKLIEKALQEAK